VEQAQGGRRGLWWFGGAALLILLAGAIIWLSRPDPRPPGAGGLIAFRSDVELSRFLRRIRAAQSRDLQTFDVESSNAAEMSMDAAPAASEPPGAAESITNTQEANVDEGGIVKVRGDLLVILRRGRLFTVSLAGGGMRAVHSIDAFPPGVNAQSDWYDEMLLSGDRVVVIGYSYSRGGTEISRFRLDASGQLRFEDAWHLKSNDYYSSRNYASRLIGNRLIFYTPLSLDWEGDPLEALPGIRKWAPGAERRPFRRIAGPTQIFVAPSMHGEKGGAIDTLHTVTSCDLIAAEPDCSATGVLGLSSRTFYVSAGAVYLWTTEWNAPEVRGRPQGSILYRMPLGGEAPGAIAASGAPVDQFSFREDPRDNVLNVLLRAESGGDAMAGPEFSGGHVALLRLPLSDFGDGSRRAEASRYWVLPEIGGDAWSFHNRFVGDHVLYGGGAFGEAQARATLVVAPVRGGDPAQLTLTHAVERIEALGADALVVGGGAERSLGFTAVELARGPARLGDVFRLPEASEGESRSHGFFFRPLSDDGASGILGLPVARAAEPAYERFFGSSASMLFLLRNERRFSPAGELGANLRGVSDDHCRASCVDWYGNARPIFLRGRVFALLGYELVEGRMAGGRINEIGRLDFTPGVEHRR
jgi:hypothetical protein